MARAETVWTVYKSNQLPPLAGFTVKHELETWLSKRDDLEDLNVWRCADNPYTTSPQPYQVPVADLAIGKPSPWSSRRGWDA